MSVLLRAASSVFLYKQLALVCTLLSSFILARLLGPEGRGALAGILVIPTLIAAFSECGMRQTAVHYIGKRDNISEIISNLLVYVFVMGLLGAIIAFSYFKSTEYNGTHLTIISASMMVLALLINNGARGVFLGFGDIRLYNVFILLQSVVILLTLSVMLYFGASELESIVIIYLLSNLFLSLVSIFTIIIKHYRILTFSFSWEMLKEMLKKSIEYGVVFALIVANYKFDILMLSHLSEDRSLGYYTISTQVVELIWQISGALMIVVFSSSANNKINVSNVCATTRVTVVLTFLVCLFLSLFGQNVIALIFGNDFKPAYISLLYLLPGAVFMVPFKIFYSMYAGQGKPLSGLKIISFAVLSNVALNFVLIPTYDEVGAAIAASISYIIAGLFMSYKVSRREGVSFKDIWLFKFNDLRRKTTGV